MINQSLVGTRLREYEILELIGQGGMGAVYKARHVYLQKERAIKVVQSMFTDNKELTDRFIREAKILSELNHPNLVQLYEFGLLDEKTFFMVLEYVRGESVLQRMRRVGKIPLDEAITIIRQAAFGLGSAHGKGIIHRDISPDNLLLVKDDTGNEITKVIDFGIAKPVVEATQQYTATNMFLGKPEYCSPEQTGVLEEGGTIDQRSDIYSLAITLYYMIAGKLPFYSPTPLGYLVKHATEPPKPILSQDLHLELPAAVDQVILKALAKDRKLRPNTMHQFVKELDDALATRTQPMSDADRFQQLFDQGKKFYDESRWSEAVREWKEAQKFSPDDDALKQWIAIAESQAHSSQGGQQSVTSNAQAKKSLPVSLIASLAVLILIVAASAGYFLLRKPAIPEKGGITGQRTEKPAGTGKLGAELRTAVTQQQRDVVQSLIASGADVNARDEAGKTALYETAGRDIPDIAQMLISAGADLNASDRDGTTPLMVASYFGREEMVDVFLKAGADVNAASAKTGDTALIKAVQNSQREIVASLLKAGAKVNVSNKSHETPLLAGAPKDRVDVLNLLLNEKPDLEAKDDRDYTSLMRASYWGMEDNVRALLKAGANVNAATDRGRETALMLAVQMSRKEIISVLLESGADVNAKSKDHNTPLLLAVRKDRTDIVQMLLDAKADLNATDEYEKTVLMNAAFWGIEDNVTTLLKAGADVNAISVRDGSTALMSALEANRIRIVPLLIQAGANINARKKDGDTPIMMAVRRNDPQMLQLLIAAKADLNARDDSDYTPLMRAASFGYMENVETLIRAGADVNATSRDGSTALFVAISAGKVDCLRALLHAGAKVSILNRNGDSPMIVARRYYAADVRDQMIDLLEKASR